MIGGVREGKLQAVGLGQQQADVFVAPVRRGQVLKEEQQLLGGDRQAQVRAGDQLWGRGLQIRSGDPLGGDWLAAGSAHGGYVLGGWGHARQPLLLSLSQHSGFPGKTRLETHR